MDDPRAERIERRLEALEDWKNETNVILSVRGAQDEHIDDRFNRIEAKLDSHASDQKRLFWIIVTAIVGGSVSFIGSLIASGLNAGT